MARLEFKHGLTALVLASLVVDLRLAVVAASTYRELQESTDPLLVAARQVDLIFQPPEVANQREAERLYLRYMDENPESPLVPYLFYHLGHMYSDKVDFDWDTKYGHVRDYAKAGRFFEEAAKRHPADKISGLLMNTRMSAAALAPTSEQRVAKYIDYYQWLSEMTKEDLDAHLWLSEDEQEAVRRVPLRKRIWVDTLWKSRGQSMRVAEANMVGAAEASDDPIALLDTIITALPDKPPGESARRRKAELLRRTPLLRVRGMNSLGAR